MCKNAGKTTTLNNLIQNTPHSEILALTSIGRDGESVDTVTQTHKPGIYIREGSLFATAQDLLQYCDVTKEIIENTNIATPLGRIVLIRALSDGHVQLAGPSTVQQLVLIKEMFKTFGADRIFIDGAVGRKSLCSRSLANASILCTGASYNKSLDETIADTAFVCNLLMTEEMTEIKTLIDVEHLSQKYALMGKDISCYPDSSDMSKILKQAKDAKYLYVEGAITDSFLKSMIRFGFPKGLIFVTRDASKLLITEETQRKLVARDGRFGVLERINLAAITINPYSAYGGHFDAQEFITKMSEAVSIPVINPMR